MTQQSSQELKNQQLLDYIKKLPFTQNINGTELTYSILDKKQQTFVLTNQRFLYLRGFQYLAYSKIMPKPQPLPFRSLLQVPVAKASVLISQIASCTFEKQVLIIQMCYDKASWQFVCQTKICALSWCRKIQQAIKQYKKFQTSRYQKYQDYIKQNQLKKSYFEYKNQQNSPIQTSSALKVPPGQQQLSSDTIKPIENRGDESNRNRNESFNTFGMKKQQFQTPMSKSKSELNLNTPDSSFLVKVPDNSQDQLIKDGKQVSKNVDKSPNLSQRINRIVQQPESKENDKPQQHKRMQQIKLDLQWTTSLVINQTLQNQQQQTNFHASFNQNNNKNRSSIKSRQQFNRLSFGSRQSNQKNEIQFKEKNSFNEDKQSQFSSTKKGGKKLSTYRSSKLNKDNNKNYVQNFNFQYLPLHRQKDQNQSGQYHLKIQSILNKNNRTQQKILKKSISQVSQNSKQNIRVALSKFRLNWAEQFLNKTQPCYLILSFKKYVQKLLQIMVQQLYMPNHLKIYPTQQQTKQHISYVIDEDIQIQFYLVDEQYVDQKPRRYTQAVKQFKNYDYLIQWSRHQPQLVVPLMSIFQYKGIIGMAKSIVYSPKSFLKDKNGQLNRANSNNKESLLQNFDRMKFQQQMRINSNLLLDNKSTNIITYHSSQNPHLQAFYVKDIKDLLPTINNSKNINDSEELLLRPEFISCDHLQGHVFNNPDKILNQYNLQLLMDKNISQFVQEIEKQKIFFIQPKQLTELIHDHGLNISNLGRIADKIQQDWFKKVIYSQAAIRSLKHLFRLQMQNCLINQTDRLITKQKKSLRQVKRVISFLNMLCGSNESTDRLWAQLNKICYKKYNIFWQNYHNDTDHKYLIQSIMYNLKITLSTQSFNKKLFASMTTFEPQDFISFTFDIKCYNLQYTELYQQIYQLIQIKDSESFQKLGSIIVQQTKNKQSLLQMLRGQNIYYDIKLFLVYFISPFVNEQLYAIQNNKCSLYNFQIKQAQLTWYLKDNRLDKMDPIVSYIIQNAQKYLGPFHPIYIKLYKLLAQYFSQKSMYLSKSLEYGNKCLEMQIGIHGSKNSSLLWKEYYLIAMIYFNNSLYQQSLNYLIQSKKILSQSARSSVKPLCIIYTALSKSYFSLNLFQEAYINSHQLLQHVKQQQSQDLLQYFIQAVNIIKNLLQRNNEEESYFKFIENDVMDEYDRFLDKPELLKIIITITLFPYLKFAINHSKNHDRILSFIQSLYKMAEPQHSCMQYILSMIENKRFPYQFIQGIKNIDLVMNRIQTENLLAVWVNFCEEKQIGKKLQGEKMFQIQWMLDMMSLIGIFGPQLLICIQ